MLRGINYGTALTRLLGCHSYCRIIMDNDFNKKPKEILEQLIKDNKHEELIEYKLCINKKLMNQLEPVLKRLGKE